MNYTGYGVNSNTGTNSTATKRICNTQAQQHKNTVTAALLQYPTYSTYSVQYIPAPFIR